MEGSWDFSVLHACDSYPQKLASAIWDLLDFDKYVPVLYCGTQLANGMNYMLIGKAVASEKAPEHLVKIILNQQDDGSIIGKWSVVSITDI